MISREQAIKTALYELEQQREENYTQEREREAEVITANPEIQKLMDRRSSLLGQGIRDAFRDPQGAKALSEKIAGEMRELNAEIRRQLVLSGFSEDYLQPITRCRECKDTGYVGEPVHELCTCVRQRMLRIMMSDAGLRDLETQNFSTYDAEVYPDEPVPGRKSTQRAYMEKVRQRLEQYANEFERDAGKGIILYGASGLGKTFLMNCVAERVLRRGFSVLKISAYRLYDVLRNYQYDQSESKMVRDLINADLLALDDMGTEPMTRNNNEQRGLYNILAERIACRRAMIITTNLDRGQTLERYGDRIANRLYDAGRMSVYQLFGEDVRRFVKH